MVLGASTLESLISNIFTIIIVYAIVDPYWMFPCFCERNYTIIVMFFLVFPYIMQSKLAL